MKAVPYILVACALAGLLTGPEQARAQLNSIEKSPHNLSVSGPGPIRATNEREVCVFCHTTHSAGTSKALWNRTGTVGAYTIYSSTSLKARPGQPTGASKLCLSCHDGTIAIGSVLSQREPIKMVNGVTTIPQGHGRLGTDLSGDHPISFRYDEALANKQPLLKNPRSLPSAVPLDSNKELQCTSCHDAHSNSLGNFLVMDNSRSQLCNACHNLGTTTVREHRQCADCHQSHAAPSGPYLLKEVKVTDTCLACHNGRTGIKFGPDIAADLVKLDRHDTASPANQANHIPNNSTCTDCHEAHTMKSGTSLAPSLQPDLGDIGGVNASGAIVTKARFEYEVCFKCHGDESADTRPIGRQIVQRSKRLQFAPSAISFHPVEAAGHNSDVPSLAPGYNISSLIYCADCHNSDNGPKSGGAGPAGTHGSSNRGLLALEYDTVDNTVESASAYALCYKCHQRSTLLADTGMTTGQPFSGVYKDPRGRSVVVNLHLDHVVNDKASCSLCHDSHGISSNQATSQHGKHLINFDTSIVRPDPLTGRLEYDATAARTGTCYLSCHNVAHSPLSYGVAAGAQNTLVRHPLVGPATPAAHGAAPGRR